MRRCSSNNVSSTKKSYKIVENFIFVIGCPRLCDISINPFFVIAAEINSLRLVNWNLLSEDVRKRKYACIELCRENVCVSRVISNLKFYWCNSTYLFEFSLFCKCIIQLEILIILDKNLSLCLYNISNFLLFSLS